MSIISIVLLVVVAIIYALLTAPMILNRVPNGLFISAAFGTIAAALTSLVSWDLVVPSLIVCIAVSSFSFISLSLRPGDKPWRA